MRFRKRLALLILSVVCFLLNLASAALGEPQMSNEVQVEAHQSPNTGQAAIEAPKTPPPAPVEIASAEPARPETGIASTPAEPNDSTTQAVESKPATKIEPLTQTKVSELKKTNPGLVSRILSATKGLVGRAVSWLGTRYAWGGNTKNGVDCSGLTRRLYMSEGVTLPRTAKLQFKVGQAVARMALLPGDLVFFNTTGYVSHVGMYIGNGKFLHANSKRGNVRVDNINAAYYSKRFAGARRLKSFG